MKKFFGKAFTPKEKERERGMVLFVALGLITIISLLAGGFLSIGVRNSHLEADFHHASNALSSAEAGIHFALGQMRAGGITPPEPELGDTTWENWTQTLETPGYSSEVEVSYVKEFMLPQFNVTTGKILEDDKVYRISSSGSGPRETKKKIEVIISPKKEIIFKIDYAVQLGSNANFSGNPITYSGNSDTLIVQLDNNNKPYFDINENGDFDQATEWGWAHGTYRLDEIWLNVPYPDSSAFSPICPGLHSHGDIHANGNLHFSGGLPRINGKGSATGTVTQSGFGPFINDINHYIRKDYTNNADPVFIGDIPTNLAYWSERATRDTLIKILTPMNVGSFPGWQYVGNKFKWSGNSPLPNVIYYLTDDCLISGNPTGNATLITDDDITVSGTTVSYAREDYMGYIAGGNIFISGSQYIQGFIYSKGDIQCPGEYYIFGAVVVKGGGVTSGNPTIVFNTKLKEMEWKFQTYYPEILSWQELIP